MSTPSRFARTRPSDAEQTTLSTDLSTDNAAQNTPQKPAPAVAPAKAAHVHNSNVQDLTVLQNRLVKVQRERLQREIELDTTQKTIQECEEAARKLGINSLEEMEAFVQRLEAEDIAAQEKFEQELESEEALLQRISQQLADLERE